MTRLEAVSDKAGRVRFRGFFGDYRIEYAPDRASAAFSAAPPGPCALTVRLGA